MKLLEGLKSPIDLQSLSLKELEQLCEQVRERIITVTKVNGGHLASSLGAVELIVALLYCYRPPKDRIIFDVGHQAYAWKLLTDRRDRFHTLRREGGVAGFPKREESPYDAFGTGHSSTALSAALGFAVTAQRRGSGEKTVAVVGDGAMINGQSFEALNHAGGLGVPMLCILNDNGISISPRVGGMARHLAALSSSKVYRGAKRGLKNMLEGCPTVSRQIIRLRDWVKRSVTPPNMFDDLGWTYWGPFDGHDLKGLIELLEHARNYEKPLLLHVVTCKGKGCDHAEANPVKYHGVSPQGPKSSGKSWSQVVADLACRWAEQNGEVLALTPAMEQGSCLSEFAARFPDRHFDGGIAEEHMMTFGGALAAAGAIPLLFIYSGFMQRAMDQLAHDISLQNLPLTLLVDRAGLVGEDGATHQGLFDLSWAATLPYMTIISPADQQSLERLPALRAQVPGPLLVRFPRGICPVDVLGSARSESGFHRLSTKGEVAVIALGPSIIQGKEAVRTCNRPLALACLEQVRPLPVAELLQFCQGRRKIITLEEGSRRGGVGEAIALALHDAGLTCPVIRLAVGPDPVEQATQERQRELCGLTASDILSHAQD